MAGYSPATVDYNLVVEDFFSYHAPTSDQLLRYDAVRSAARAFALVLYAETPTSADQTAAIRKLRECVMTANASIALGGR
jgi:hypothetical protein